MSGYLLIKCPIVGSGTLEDGFRPEAKKEFDIRDYSVEDDDVDGNHNYRTDYYPKDDNPDSVIQNLRDECEVNPKWVLIEET